MSLAVEALPSRRAALAGLLAGGALVAGGTPVLAQGDRFEVVREKLRDAATRIGLEPRYRITFDTQACGVRLSARTREKFPAREMTIVLQYEYANVSVGKDEFAVDLSFASRHERVRVPYGAIIALYDVDARQKWDFEPNVPACARS